MSTQQPESIAQERKYKWSKRILVFAVIILFMRLFDLQILKGDEMKRLSEQNRVRIKKILAPRGTIFDRKGRILGNTRPSFNLYIIPEDIKDFTETVDGIVNLLELDRDDIIERLKEARDFPSSFPVKILSDMSMDQVAKVEANKFYLPAISIQIEPKRNYPNGTMAAHVLGYVSEVSTDELKSPEFKKYAPGDPIGKFGLERMYEKDLRGVDGEKRVEVDASGREVRVLDIKEPISGNGIYLNIDLDVQEALEKGLYGKNNEHKAGAASYRTPAQALCSPLRATRPSIRINLHRARGNTGRPSLWTSRTLSRIGQSRADFPRGRPSSPSWRLRLWKRASSTSTPPLAVPGTSPLAAACSSAGRRGAMALWPCTRVSWNRATSSFTTRA